MKGKKMQFQENLWESDPNCRSSGGGSREFGSNQRRFKRTA